MNGTSSIAETSSGAVEYTDLGSGPPVLVVHGTRAATTRELRSGGAWSRRDSG